MHIICTLNVYYMYIVYVYYMYSICVIWEASFTADFHMTNLYMIQNIQQKQMKEYDTHMRL